EVISYGGPPKPGFDYAVFREYAGYFVAEGRLAEARGDRAVAIQRYLDAMELGSKLANGSGTAGWRVALDCHAAGFPAAERLTPILSRSATLVALERVRRVMNGWPPMAELLENERITFLGIYTWEFQRLQRLPLWMQYRPTFRTEQDASPWEKLQF